MHFPRWTIPAAAAVTASGLVLAACGQQGAARQRNAAAGGPAAPPARQSAAPAVEPASLQVNGLAQLGKVVTDGAGMTLYRFDEDTAKPSASNCTDACATAWPPVPAGEGETRVTGVDRSIVGKVKRPDGTWQVTLAGWPLYRFAKDQSPGDVKGQGKGGTWYAAAPTGKKAEPANEAEPEAGNGNGDGGGEDGRRWAGKTVIKAEQDANLGLILTDGEGRTFYRYDKDTSKPPNSNCSGACKKAWPPVIFNGWKNIKLDGVSREVVGFIEREDDGECQLTINGWPMYYYAKDEQPGDVNGQGVGGVWWATTPEGGKAEGTGSGGGGGGYGSGGGSGGGY